MTSEVFNTDCLEYMRTLPDKCFQLAIADPPYRDENAPFQQMRQASASRDVFKAGKPSQEFFDELNRISENQIIWGANNFGFEYRGFVAWDKMVRGSDRYSQVEIASLSEGLATVSTLVQISTYQTEDKIHPTQKPVPLLEYLVKTYTNEGDIVLDNCMGSGSTGVACVHTNRQFIGMELDTRYFEIASKRINEA